MSKKFQELLNEQAKIKYNRFLQKILCEADEGLDKEKSSEEEEIGDSLDAQIDRYFAEYEKDSKELKIENLSYRLTRDFLFEAGEDDQGQNAEKEEKSASDEKTKVDDTKLTPDNIDVEAFSNNIVRLIDNYDNLLEVKNTIVRRAKNFLAKNYDEDVINLFIEDLEQNHGISLKSKDGNAPTASRSSGGGDLSSGGGSEDFGMGGSAPASPGPSSTDMGGGETI